MANEGKLLCEIGGKRKFLTKEEIEEFNAVPVKKPKNFKKKHLMNCIMFTIG